MSAYGVGTKGSMRPEHVAWCRQHYAMMKEGGTWIVPRSGLAFTKREGKLVLTGCMPGGGYAPEIDYRETKLHFEAAGIPVESEIDLADV